MSRPAERDLQPENRLYGGFEHLMEGLLAQPEEGDEHRTNAGEARRDPLDSREGLQGDAFKEAFPRGPEGRALPEAADAVIWPGSPPPTRDPRSSVRKKSMGLGALGWQLEGSGGQVMPASKNGKAIRIFPTELTDWNPEGSGRDDVRIHKRRKASPTCQII